MLKDIIEVEVLEEHRLRITFEDGVTGEVDLDDFLKFDGVFERLQDPEEFQKVFVDHESGKICWPGGADLDPAVLYARVTGSEIQTEAQPGSASAVHEDGHS